MALWCAVLACGPGSPALAQQPTRAQQPERDALVPALPGRDDASSAGPGSPQPGASSERPRGVLQALLHTVSLDFVDTPVTDILRCLELEGQVALRVDTEVSSLLRRRTPRVSVQAQKVSVAGALRLVLGPLELCVALHDEELIIVSARRLPEGAIVVPVPPGPALRPPPPGRVLPPQLSPPSPAPRQVQPDLPRPQPALPMDTGPGES